MNLRARKILELYYISCLILVLSILITGAVYQWRTGAFNLDNIASVYESGLVLEDIKSVKSPREIKKLVQNDRVRESLTVVNQLRKNARSLDKSFTVDSFLNFDNSLKTTEAMLKQLISYPKQDMIISVLVSKVDSFKSFVISRNWKTLTRMSSRLKAKMSSKKMRSPHFFTARKLGVFIKGVRAEIATMKKVTNDSILSQLDKNDVNRRLGGLLVEISMLENYIKSLRRFNGQFSRFNTHYNQWVKDIGPEITLKTIELEKTSHYLKIIFLAVVATLIIFIMIGIFLNSKSASMAQKEIEKIILKSVRDGLFPTENKISWGDSSLNFLKEFEKNREYFHKRISFGTVFQEAIPFSSLLLDSNLNLSWANDLFYRDWNMENKSEDEMISWDYLSQYTNLGEDDPIVQALKHDIAGIYQVQIKSPVTGESSPFEMYVSPIDYSGQKRIMIFLYPLRNLEETLSNQVKSIVGPVTRTFEVMSKGEFEGEVRQRLEKDYEVAGIKELFDKIDDYASQSKLAMDGLYKEIESLEKHYYDQVKLVTDIKEISKMKSEHKDKFKDDFNSCKNSVIQAISIKEEVGSTLGDAVKIAGSILDSKQQLLSLSVQTKNILNENLSSYEKIGESKEQFKLLKDDVAEHTGKLSGLVEQMMLTIRRNNLDPRLEESLSFIRREIKDIDKMFSGFNQSLRQLDVTLSKVEMLMQNAELPNLEEYTYILASKREEIESLQSQMGDLEKHSESIDQDVVNSFKSLFAAYKRGDKEDYKISAILNPNFEEQSMMQGHTPH